MNTAHPRAHLQTVEGREVKKIKVSEATDLVLDWMVAKAEGKSTSHALDRCRIYGRLTLVGGVVYQPSTDWSRGGPIIEQEKIELRHDGRKSWCAWIEKTGAVHGPAPLIAAMRCFVSSKFGDEVEVPEELL